MKRPWTMRALAPTAKGQRQAEILIYEDIGEGWFGGLSAKAFAEELKALGALDLLDIRINSYGGAIFDGFAIYNTLVRHPARKTAHVDGVAASSASVIAMAGDEVRIAANGFVMVHNPWGFAQGYAEELRKQADLLDQVRSAIAGVYAAKTSLGLDALLALMDAETWMDSAEAVAKGFADAVAPEMQLAALADPARFRRPPERLIHSASPPSAPPRADALRQRLARLDLATHPRKD